MKFATTALFLVLCICLGGSHPAFGDVVLTSMTLDAELADGTTANSDYWTTNTTDSTVRLGVTSGGAFLNQPGPGYDLGEIAIHLQPGINIFQIYGLSSNDRCLISHAPTFTDWHILFLINKVFLE